MMVDLDFFYFERFPDLFYSELLHGSLVIWPFLLCEEIFLHIFVKKRPSLPIFTFFSAFRVLLSKKNHTSISVFYYQTHKKNHKLVKLKQKAMNTRKPLSKPRQPLRHDSKKPIKQ